MKTVMQPGVAQPLITLKYPHLICSLEISLSSVWRKIVFSRASITFHLYFMYLSCMLISLKNTCHLHQKARPKTNDKNRHPCTLSSTDDVITVINMFRKIYDKMENFSRERSLF